jgi:hypothetical protein
LSIKPAIAFRANIGDKARRAGALFLIRYFGNGKGKG